MRLHMRQAWNIIHIMLAHTQVVLGASLFAANLSTSFRLRKFGMADAAMYGVSLRFDELHKPVQLGVAAPASEESDEVRQLMLDTYWFR